MLVAAVTEADVLEAGGERHGLVNCGEFRQAAQHVDCLGARVDHAPAGRLHGKYSSSKYRHAPAGRLRSKCSPSKHRHAPPGRLYSIYVHLVRGDDGGVHEETLFEDALRLLPRVGVGMGVKLRGEAEAEGGVRVRLRRRLRLRRTSSRTKLAGYSKLLTN